MNIRFMSWNIQNYGSSKFINTPQLSEIIATLMRKYQIDICALIEIKNNAHLQIRNGIVASLINIYPGPPANINNWYHAYVNAGNEGTAYIWRENGRFRGLPYINNINNEVVAGKVLKNDIDARIFFPKTNTPWGSLPGKPNGRRPTYCIFETTDASPRTFSFLDFHTPFDTSNSIQSYATHLYASSREISEFENFSTLIYVRASYPNALVQVKNVCDPLLTTINPALPLPNFVYTVDSTRNVIEEDLVEGQDYSVILLKAAIEGVSAALAEIRHFIIPGSSTVDYRIVEVGVKAGVGAAILLMESFVTLPANTLNDLVSLAITPTPIDPSAKRIKPSPAQVFGSTRNKAKDEVTNFINALGNTPPSQIPSPLNTSIIAGDFNVPFDDNRTYRAAQQVLLGGPGKKAYDSLLELTGPNPPALNDIRTTRIGPTAFENQYIYTLNPHRLAQHGNPGAANYLPLDLTGLAGREIMGHGDWGSALRGQPRMNTMSYKKIFNDYSGLLDQAFDMEVINDTSYYLANAYDNFFIRPVQPAVGGVPVINFQSAEVIDVISELGSWPARTGTAHDWDAAEGALNGIAQNRLQARYYFRGNRDFTFGSTTYTLSPNLNNAIDAAVFFSYYISDHLPIVVEVDI